MAQPFARPYLDSSVYIAAILGEEAEPGKGDLSSQILELGRTGRYPILASTFVFAEVIRDRGRPDQLDAEQEASIDRYLSQDFITWVEVDLPIARKARSLSRFCGLKPVDAVHLASAIRAKCDQFLTWDESDFADGTEIEGIHIHRPHLTELPVQLPGTS
jgi:predicted nucleic acid-binding protein